MTALAQHDTTRRLVPAAFAGAVGASAAITVAAGPLAGAACDAIVLLGLLNAYVLVREDAESRALVLLALVSLLLLINLALPVADISRTVRDLLVGAVLLLAIAIVCRVVPVDYRPLELAPHAIGPQLLLAACGIPLGIVGELILRPQPLVPLHDRLGAVLAAVVLTAVVAPVLELLFRWLLQPAMLALYGGAGLALLNALFASLYLGTRSVGFVLLMGVTGLGLSLAVRRTGMVWGAVVAHAILDVGVLIIWPAVLR
jgi:membrane protease YdiL (CAAX protease family)